MRLHGEATWGLVAMFLRLSGNASDVLLYVLTSRFYREASFQQAAARGTQGLRRSWCLADGWVSARLTMACMALAKAGNDERHGRDRH